MKTTVMMDLGNGKVAIGALLLDGIPTLMLSTLDQPFEIGAKVPTSEGDLDRDTIYIRMGNIEAARVLLRQVKSVVRKLEADGWTSGELHLADRPERQGEHT